MKTRQSLPLGAILLSLLPACGVPSLSDDGDPNHLDGGAGPGDGGGGGGATSGLPCDVAAVLQKYCTSCHGATPSGGAPTALVSYADLTQASPKGGTYAARSLARMKDTAQPMPPKPAAAVPLQEIAAFEAWVNGGAAMGTCSTGGGTDPFAAAPVCTSKTSWTRGNSESSRMNPGLACIACHKTYQKAPAFFIAGTVYPTGHEPDLCNAPAATVAGAVVEITGQNGVVRRATVNSVGNFYLGANSGLTAPYTAKVIQNGKTRAMVSPQSDGDCNGCHTQNGASKAPGRIALP